MRRLGFYRHTSAGVQPQARRSDIPGAAPSPFAVEVLEAGTSGFQFPDVTSNGVVSLSWGSVNFEEPALTWVGSHAPFESEARLASAAGPGPVSFRFDDEEGSFAFSLSAPAWSIPTPEFSEPALGQILDPGAAITFQWTQLVRDGSNDLTFFQIREEEDDSTRAKVAFSSVPCDLPFPVPSVVVMPLDATSITVPAGILTNRQARYVAELTILRFQATRQGAGALTWSANLVDQKLTQLPLSLSFPNETSSPFPPRITTQMASQTVKEGGLAILSVVAEGSSPLTYQWRKDGVDLPSAFGSILIIFSAAAADQGAYQVTVSNGEGSVVSDWATLTVVTDPLTPTSWVSAQLRLAPGGSGGGELVAVPTQSGSLILQISSDLTTWSPWRTQQVTLRNAINIPIDFRAFDGPVRFFRSAPPPPPR